MFVAALPGLALPDNPVVAVVWRPDAALVDKLAPLVESRLMAETSCDFLDRENVDRILGEHSRTLMGMTSAQKGIRIGQLCSADIVVCIEDDRAAGTSSVQTELLGLHVQVYEVASSLKLLDQTLTVQSADGTRVEMFTSEASEAIQAGIEKWPAETKGVPTVAVAEVRCGGWKRDLFPAARAYPSLLSRLLLQDGNVALVERRILGTSSVERFVEDVPSPLAAAVIVRTTMRRTRDGRTAIQTSLFNGEETRLPEVICDNVTLDVIGEQAGRILQTLQGDTGQTSAVGSLRDEARNIFVRSYVLAREESFDAAYELAESACILDPSDEKARRLRDRVYARMLKNDTTRWANLSPQARTVLLEEVSNYIESFYQRVQSWFDDNYESLVGGGDGLLLFGEIGEGYELGTESLLRFGNFIREHNELKRLSASGSRKFNCAYEELILETRDPRLLHRPRVWDFVGPERLEASLRALEDDEQFVEAVKRYHDYQSGDFEWDPTIAPYVNEYSADVMAPPAIVVDRYRTVSRDSNWAALKDLCRWLEQRDGALAATWRAMILLGLSDRAAFNDGPSIDNAKLRDTYFRNLLLVTDRLTNDGCDDRQYKSKLALLRGATEHWNKASVQELMQYWQSGTSLRPETRAAMAVTILQALQKRDDNQAHQIAREALTFMLPGSNGYDEIMARKRQLDVSLGVAAPAAAIWKQAEGLFETEARAAAPCWIGFHSDGKGLWFREDKSSLVYRVDLSSGAAESYEYASLGLRAADGQLPPPGSQLGSGVMCAGKYWFPVKEQGLVVLDPATGTFSRFGSREGFYSDYVTRITAARGKLYGLALGPYTPDAYLWSYGRKRPFVLFELDPETGTFRVLDGSGSETGRMAGSNSIDVLNVLGDDARNGLWLMETWDRLQFPHFYDLTNGKWIRIRINAFQWQLTGSGRSLRNHPDGILFERYLYQPELDRFSFLPHLEGPGTDLDEPAAIDLRMPVMGWRDQVWGVSSDGLPARVSADGNHTEYGERFFDSGMRIQQIYEAGDALVFVVTGGKKIQVWRMLPAPLKAGDQPISTGAPVSGPILQQPESADTQTSQRHGDRQKTPLVFEGHELPDLFAIRKPEVPDLSRLAAGSAAARKQQDDYARTAGLPVEAENRTAIRFRLVPPGQFTMGNPRAYGDFSLIRATTLRPVIFTRPLYVSQYEVTQAEWKRVIGHASLRFGAHGDDLPMDEISWSMCGDFLRELCKQEQVAEGTYRLLSEAEWEYACRAGTETYYCFGDTLDRKQANVLNPGGEYPLILTRRPAQPPEPFTVGSFSPNAWGLHDMHGSVSEWCQDTYWPRYPSSAVTNPVPETRGWKRLYRGGNRHNSAPMDFSAYFCDYARVSADVPARGFGFRIARELPDKGH